MKIKELNARLLVASYLHAQKIGFGRPFELGDAAQKFRIPYENGMLRVIARDWEQAGIANVTYTIGGGADRGLHTELRASGIKAAEEMLEANPDYGKPFFDSEQHATPDSDAPSGGGLLGGAVLGDPVFASAGPTMSGPTMSGPTMGPNLGAPNLGLRPIVPASDRYVSVRDNQEPFDALEKSLDQILQEFSKDHDKNNLINSDEAQFLKAEIAAVKAQIQQGYVSFRQLYDQLKPALTAASALIHTEGAADASLARMISADFRHWKGFGFSLFSAR